MAIRAGRRYDNRKLISQREKERYKLNILLVEPYYPRSEPPLGLMKLSTWHKQHGNQVRFIRGTDPFNIILGDYKPDQVDITTPIFSWRTDEGTQTIKWCLERFPDAHIRVGGVKAWDTPDVYEIDRVELVRGNLSEVDECSPDYSLLPNLGRSVIYTMRGCPVGCGFCRVWRESGKTVSIIKNWKSHINYDWNRLIIQDDNIIAAPSAHLKEVCKVIKDNDFSVDFNSGFEVHQFDEEYAKILSGIKIKPVRTAFDELKEESEFLNTMSLIKSYITSNWRNIMVYVLFNYLETPEECLYRALKVVEAGGSPYVMPFTPNNWIKGDMHRGEPFISEKYGWDLDKIKKFYRFWNRYWIWISVIKQRGTVTLDEIWQYKK